MKSTGIIMSGNHPVKILDGKKTNTRRTAGLKEINENPDDWFGTPEQVEGALWRFFNKDGTSLIVKCPFGGVGDNLWCRENWRTYVILDNCKASLLPSTCPVKYEGSPNAYKYSSFIFGRLRPSIFMPKWASRITLEITDIHPERLRMITPEDAIREGGYTVEEFIKLYIKLNHLPEDADPWNWAIRHRIVSARL